MSSSADKLAKTAEDTRNRRIHEGIGQVNAIYGSGREAQYGDYLQALRDRGAADLSDQSAIVDRKSKFQLARRGVIGGSSELDKQRRNRKALIRATIGNERNAQVGVGKLRSADENSRQSLLNMIFSGMDASTAAQRGSASMRSNMAMAQSDFIPYALDSIGEAAADAYGYGVREDAYSAGGEAARRNLYGG
jgi:hypothetical protein